MRFPGTSRRRYHAHRLNRRPAPATAARRFPIPIGLAVAAALLIAGQPLAAGSPAPSAKGDRSGMAADGLAGDVGAAVAVVPTRDPGGGTAPDPTPDRGSVDDQATFPDLSGYRWPLAHARITQAFGPSSGGLFVVNGVRFHDGIDIANYCGAPILAAHAGVVIGAGRRVTGVSGWVGDVASYDARLDAKNLWGSLALTVVIDDGNEYQSIYVHMRRVDVKVGQVVRAGDVIGLEGSTGHSTGCHLHYSLYSPSDPTTFETYPEDVTRYLLPAAEIARINPLSVLPSLRAGDITWGWGAQDRG